MSSSNPTCSVYRWGNRGWEKFNDLHPCPQHPHHRAILQLGLEPDLDSGVSWLQPSTASASHTRAGLRTPRRLVKHRLPSLRPRVSGSASGRSAPRIWMPEYSRWHWCHWSRDHNLRTPVLCFPREPVGLNLEIIRITWGKTNNKHTHTHAQAPPTSGQWNPNFWEWAPDVYTIPQGILMCS